jgi:hypothetical protein
MRARWCPTRCDAGALAPSHHVLPERVTDPGFTPPTRLVRPQMELIAARARR